MKFDGINILIFLIAAGCIVVLGIFAYTIMTGFFDEQKQPDGIIKITSGDELKSFLKAHQKTYEYSVVDEAMDLVFGLGMSKSADRENIFSPETGLTGQMPQMPMPTAVPTSASSASDYSETNIQVKGVDEADFVKNDGKYIYMVKGNNLMIIDAYPAEEAEIIFEDKIEGYSTSALFLYNNRLVVFSTGYEDEWTTPEISSAPVPVTIQITYAKVYDISDRKNPELIRTLKLPGFYEDSRMIDNYIYAISKNSVSSDSDVIMPVVRQNGDVISKPEIWCPPVYEYNFVLHTVTSFNINSDDDLQSEAFLTGRDNTLYVSKDNIFMAYERYLPSNNRYSITKDSEISSDNERQNTVIHRFSIDRGDIKYKATGTVPGSLLNQWSLDEYNKNLRVATTINSYSANEYYMYNCVYVLDDSLNIIGRLEHIAPDEKIYSARFTGSLLYLVTFKQIDPFFVIDLSNPKQPGILGELKIPGYSDYLHPYDENHIIGIGKSTSENKWGGVTTEGLKIALFDVTDLNNPVLNDELIIGEAGTDSEVLSDHKAFLFDYEKNILVLPVDEITKIPVEDSRYENSYSRGRWNGVYVLGINSDYSFTIKGKVKHEGFDSDRYWYPSDSVKRSIFMDDNLYTISDYKIVISNLSNLGDAIKSIEIQKKPTEPPYYPYNHPELMIGI
ncbi:beta-propeller domain-containing protein [Methanomicrobium antiquum]|uniref:Beta-propeller domain-containing protein n=1 Tax=Methanomicrobium antiquum TaxID=487686 RepID=A0AAF0FP89_9EURY|nr:beta-propeller domain-containing protein [Methanomicrobium antiquum]WFN37102.1 beta-propeller domain-containing protein [Methanomicrobium antiquum]